MAKKKRSRLYVDPTVQLALARRVILHWLIFFVVAVALATCFEFLSNPFRDFWSLIEQVISRYAILLTVLFALIPIFVYDTVKLSNRFAGPMLRFRRALRQLSEGEAVAPLIVRKRDFWHGLAEDFNRALALRDAAEPQKDAEKRQSESGKALA